MNNSKNNLNSNKNKLNSEIISFIIYIETEAKTCLFLTLNLNQ